MRKLILMALATYVMKRYFSRDTPKSAGADNDTDTGNGSRKARSGTTSKPRAAPRRRAAAATHH